MAGMPVQFTSSDRGVRSGQITSVDGTGVALSTAGIGCVWVTVQNDILNTVNIVVGGSLATAYFVLSPGNSHKFYTGKVDNVFVKSASGTALKVNWLAVV